MAGTSAFRFARSAAGWRAPALALSDLADCGDDTVAAGQPKDEVREYRAKTLAIETYPQPDIDFRSASPDQIAVETRRFAAQLVPLAEQVQAATPAEIRKDIDVLVAAVR